MAHFFLQDKVPCVKYYLAKSWLLCAMISLYTLHGFYLHFLGMIKTLNFCFILVAISIYKILTPEKQKVTY